MSEEKNSTEVAPHPVLDKYYEDKDARHEKVNEMFDASAPHYDWITEMMSFGSGRWYRKDALIRNGLKEGMSHLDVGSGTGAIAFMGQELVGESGRVIALDPSAGMLAEAKKLGVKNIVQGVGENTLCG